MNTMRLNRFLASCGLGSRRQCEHLILDGKVTLNGKRVLELATTIGSKDVVTCEGKLVKPEALATVLLHKPAGVLCTKYDPKDRPTIYDLLPPPLQNLHYVGRLDQESEGLLLLTNDGDLTQHLTHPSHVTEKEYWVILNRPFRVEDAATLRAGMQLEEGLAVADSVEVISPRHVSVILHQGLNRQIRRMFEMLDYEVTRLVRIRIGALDIGQLKPGKWRHLHEPDLERLHLASDKPAGAKKTAARKPRKSQKSTAPTSAAPKEFGKRPAAKKTSFGRKPVGAREGGIGNRRRDETSVRGPAAGPRRKSANFDREVYPSATSRPAFPKAKKKAAGNRSEASWAFAKPKVRKDLWESGDSGNERPAPRGKFRPAKRAPGSGSGRGGAGARPKGPSPRRGR
jgi:23S rRNA pseudouridine2605 synthase